METPDKSDKNDNRDNTITLKVTNNEKEQLQQMADEIGLSLSDFIRTKALADEKFFSQLINENSKLKEEVKGLRVKASFGLPTAQTLPKGNISINLSPEKQKIYTTLLAGSYVPIDPDDEESDSRWMTIGEQMEWQVDEYLLRRAYNMVYEDKVIKIGQPIGQAIKHGHISVELARRAYPDKEFELE